MLRWAGLQQGLPEAWGLLESWRLQGRVRAASHQQASGWRLGRVSIRGGRFVELLACYTGLAQQAPACVVRPHNHVSKAGRPIPSTSMCREWELRLLGLLKVRERVCAQTAAVCWKCSEEAVKREAGGSCAEGCCCVFLLAASCWPAPELLSLASKVPNTLRWGFLSPLWVQEKKKKTQTKPQFFCSVT